MNIDGPAHLLAFLRERLGDRHVEFDQALRPLKGGAFTEVLSFALTGAPDRWMGPLVLRLYPKTDNRDQPRLELAVQNAVADAGFPAPRVLLAHCEPDVLGQMFVVMERLPGRAFLRGIRWDQFARDFPRVVVAWPSVLARLQNRLHELEPSSVLKATSAQSLMPRAYRRIDTLISSKANSKNSVAMAPARPCNGSLPTSPPNQRHRRWSMAIFGPPTC